MTSPADFIFVHRLRVRWSEVDAQQVVFNAHYLNYLDVAIANYWREVGLPYPEGLQHVQGDLYMRASRIEYHAPARLDDWLDVGVQCTQIGHSSVTMSWSVWAQERTLVTGEAVYVFTDLSTGRAAPIPDSLRAQIEAHAQERPVHQVKVGSWAELGDAAHAVRRAVFIDEQGVPESEEWDDDDAQAVHVVACNLAGLPLATGRLIYVDQAHRRAKVGRMAVLRSSRGVGLGQLMLETLIQQARQRDIGQMALHAQVSAQGFYARLGFCAEGAVFDEVGIPHQRMTLVL